MTETLQVSCVQMHWARSLESNLERTLHYIGAAADAGSRAVLFPEANVPAAKFAFNNADKSASTACTPVVWRQHPTRKPL